MPTYEQWWPLPDRALLAELLAAYAEPGRGYHDLEHLCEVLQRIDEITGATTDLALNLDVVRLAAFFHDAVYRTEAGGTQSNEEASARWAERALGPLLPADQVARVGVLVRATSAHQAAPDDLEAAVLLDADLAILAADRERYGRYLAGVRREYAWVPEAQFRAGRAQVLADLAGRDQLFHTAYAQRTWEQAARRNLAAELAALADGERRNR